MAKWESKHRDFIGLGSDGPAYKETPQVVEADLMDTDGENVIFFNIDQHTGYESVTAVHRVGNGWTKVKEN